MTLEGSDTPAAEVEVRLLFGLLSLTRRTDKDGRFAFEQLLPGKYSVRIVPPEGMRVTEDGTVAVTVVAGPEPTPADFELAPTGGPSVPAGSAVAAGPMPAASPVARIASPAPVEATAALAATRAPTQAVALAPLRAEEGTSAPGPSPSVPPAPSAQAAPSPSTETSLATAPTGTPVVAAWAAAGNAPVVAASPVAVEAPMPVVTPDAVVAGAPASGEAPAAVGSPSAPELAASPADDAPEPTVVAAAAPAVLLPPPSLDGRARPGASPGPAADQTLAARGPPTPSDGDAPRAVSEPPRRVIESFAELQAGDAEAGATPLRAMTTDTSFMLAVPFRTQIDGTSYSLVNCGPASLSMVLAAFGLDADPPSIRDYLNFLVGNYDTEQGTSLYVLANIAREAGLNVFPSERGSLQGWTIQDIRRQISAGNPVITLTKYRRLPGHLGSQTDFDHYVVITGLAGDDFVYNDGAFATEYGRNLIISPAQLEQAWADSSNPRHAVAIGRGDGIRPLPSFPRRLLEVTSGPNETGPTLPATPTATATPRPVRPPALERLRDRLLENLGARSAVVEPTAAATTQ